MSAVLDPEALALLTPEERAAIEDPEFTASDKAAIAKIAAGAGDEIDDDDADGLTLDADGNPVAKVMDGADAAAAKAAPPAAADSVAVADSAPTDAPRPPYEARLPDDYQAKVDDIKARTADLKTKFKAGEIEFDAFETQSEALLTEREALTVARAKAEISQEMTAQTAANTWANTVNAFYATVAKADGVDYRADATRQADLDTFVKALANNQANEGKTMQWFLDEAHKRVQALHGVIATPAETKDPLKEALGKRKPPVAALAQSLAQVPGGDGPGDVGSEFAHLDALDGDALESAIAKMTPSQREKFARGE